MQDIENGHQAIQAALHSQVTLPPAALKRLARLFARAEGAQQVAQAAMGAAQQSQQALQLALNEACEDEGLVIPAGGQAPVDIDWRTGVVKVQPPTVPVPPPPDQLVAASQQVRRDD